MSRINAETVRHIALLSRLDIEDSDIERLAGELEDILVYIEKLNQLDTRDVPPTSHPLAMENVLREDVARPSFSVEDVLANAPERDGAYFKTPPILQEM